jgi:hypothetical protein
VKYQKVTILFYAMVDNYSPDICLPHTFTNEILKKYNLDRVTFTHEGTFTDYDKLCDQLELLYKQVAESSISSEEEGAVLYFIENYQS